MVSCKDDGGIEGIGGVLGIFYGDVVEEEEESCEQSDD